MKLRVAIDVIPIRTDGRIGGLLPATLALIEAFLRRPEELDIILLTAAWNHDFFTGIVGEERVLQVMTDAPPPTAGLWARAWSKFRRILAGPPKTFANLKADVMFCPMSAISLYREDLPTICQINDIQHEYYPQFFTPEESSHRTRFYQDLCNRAKALVAISQYTKDTFCEKYAFPAERVHVIHLSVQGRLLNDGGRENEELTAWLRDRGLAGKRYLYYPANFWAHKNHEILLTAFNRLVHDGSDLHLVLTGSLADARPALRDAVQQMGLKGKVHFLGYVTDEQIAAVFRHCFCLVFPSLFEGFGIPLVEAMAFGKPILCSNSTCLPEVAGTAALYFDPRKPDEICDAIKRLEEEPGLYQEMQARGMRRLQAFDPEKMADEYIGLFRQWSKKTV